MITLSLKNGERLGRRGVAAPLQPLLPQARGLPHDVEPRGLEPQQGRLRPLRRPHRRHPRRLQDRPAPRRVRPAQAPHLQFLGPSTRRDHLETPRRKIDRNVLDRRPNPSLPRPGRHRLSVQHPRRDRRAEHLHGEGVLRAQRRRLRLLGKRRRLHHRVESAVLRFGFPEPEPGPAGRPGDRGPAVLYGRDRAAVHYVW